MGLIVGLTLYLSPQVVIRENIEIEKPDGQIEVVHEMCIRDREKKQEEKNTEKVKKRTSLKNIIGGDILATDFFRRQAGLLFLIMVLIDVYKRQERHHGGLRHSSR